MMVDTQLLVPMTDANQNFSKVVKMVEQHGFAVILKNNKPRYIVVEFDEYEDIQSAKELRRKTILSMADSVISENREAFEELAK